MADEIKIEFGADFKRWLTAKILLTSLVLTGVGYYLYHRISTAAAQQAAKDHEREVGIEGTPVLVGVTRDWFNKKEGNPGLKLTKMMIKGLDLKTAEVAKAQERALPPQVGTLNYDNETMFLVKCRFNGELAKIKQMKEKVFTKEHPYEKFVERPIKFGDKVKQGDVLAEFWSVTLGTAKATFVDAISAVRLSQDALKRIRELYRKGAVPLATLKQAERQLQGDNNNLMTAERTLRMYKLNNDEIAALRKEANEIIDALLLDPTGRISKIDGAGLTLLLDDDDKEVKEYTLARNCKFCETVKDGKKEIEAGLKADIFQFEKLGKKGPSAKVVTDDKGEVTEIIVSMKERNILDEVDRWARTPVCVPVFDKAHPDRELTLVEKNTNIGDIVDNTNFSTWLFRVADMSRLQIWVHPAEEFLPLIHEGMKKKEGLKWEIRVQADPNAPPLTLAADLICPSIEPNQHNPMVIGYLPNKDHKYLVGQFVTATLKMPPEDNTVEIPTTAINEYNGQSFVFAQDREGEYSIRRVAVVQRYAEFSVVRSELRPQDKKFSADEVKEGRYPLRKLRLGERVVTHGVVEMTSALETLLNKEAAKLQK